MAAREITTQFPSICAACGRRIKSGKRALFNTESRRLYHNHRDYGDCPDHANEAARSEIVHSIREFGSEYFTSGQYDRDEEGE